MYLCPIYVPLAQQPVKNQRREMNRIDLLFTDLMFSTLKRDTANMLISLLVLIEKPWALWELTRRPEESGRGVSSSFFWMCLSHHIILRVASMLSSSSTSHANIFKPMN